MAKTKVHLKVRAKVRTCVSALTEKGPITDENLSLKITAFCHLPF